MFSCASTHARWVSVMRRFSSPDHTTSYGVRKRSRPPTRSQPSPTGNSHASSGRAEGPASRIAAGLDARAGGVLGASTTAGPRTRQLSKHVAASTAAHEASFAAAAREPESESSDFMIESEPNRKEARGCRSFFCAIRVRLYRACAHATIACAHDTAFTRCARAPHTRSPRSPCVQHRPQKRVLLGPRFARGGAPHERVVRVDFGG